MAAAIRFFLDENIPLEVAAQLRRRGIEVFTVRDLGLLGGTDRDHLTTAARLGCVLCTHDADFVELAAMGASHAGIIFGQQHRHSVGEWVRFLELIHAVYEPDEMHEHVEYLLVI